MLKNLYLNFFNEKIMGLGSLFTKIITICVVLFFFKKKMCSIVIVFFLLGSFREKKKTCWRNRDLLHNKVAPPNILLKSKIYFS